MPEPLPIVKADPPRFNILSLDSCKYKGIMIAKFISEMEDQAYTIASVNKCIPARKSKKVAVTELFDLVAGSETGGIIATSLVIPNRDPVTKQEQKNAYFSTDVIGYFERNTDTLYFDHQMPPIQKVIIVVYLMGILCYVVFLSCQRRYHIEGFNERIIDLKTYLKMKKRIIKDKEHKCDIEKEEMYTKVKERLFSSELYKRDEKFCQIVGNI